MRDSTDWLSQEGREQELKAVEAVSELQTNSDRYGYRFKPCPILFGSNFGAGNRVTTVVEGDRENAFWAQT
jgi:hypothetical protein